MSNALPGTYAVIDLETTGLNTFADQIIEIGVLRVVDGEVMGLEQTLVKPDNLMVLPKVITDLTGLTLEDLAGGIAQKDVQGWLSAVVSSGFPIVGHNFLRFDLPLIQNTYARHGFSAPFGPERVLDTTGLYLGAMMFVRPLRGERAFEYCLRMLRDRPRGVKFNLEVACRSLGVQMEGVRLHRAAGDVELIRRLYEILRFDPVYSPREFPYFEDLGRPIEPPERTALRHG